MNDGNDKIHIVMAADGAYWKGLEVAKASMVASCSTPERLVFHLFGDDKEITSRIKSDFGTYKGSPMAFLRLYLGVMVLFCNIIIGYMLQRVSRLDVLGHCHSICMDG
jgi:hypothetical protein